jgi:hypothetical protein
MELILNLAWALVSMALVALWLRGSRLGKTGPRRAGFHRAPRHIQILALLVVVLLLLPVISLSDDLMAAQGFAETDSCLRRAQDCGCAHPAPASFALPEEIVADILLSGFSQEILEEDSFPAVHRIAPAALDSRPPPRAQA